MTLLTMVRLKQHDNDEIYAHLSAAHLEEAVGKL